MKIFVTGASGFIGSQVVPELIRAGHQVVGLARSDASAEKIRAAGAEVLRGDLNDLESLKTGAVNSDGVIHLGFIHDFANFMASIQTDAAAIETLGRALEGTNKPLVIASGTLAVSPGKLATENDQPDPKLHPRIKNAADTLALAKKGVRSVVMRLSPTVHGEHDHGFIKTLANIAKEKGVSGYLGEGASRWNAVHVLDAAVLFRLAVEKAAPGSTLHAVGEEAITNRAIAAAIGAQLGVPVKSIPADQVAGHFGWIGNFFGMDGAASSAITQEKMGWKPAHQGLLADIEAGYYT